MKYLNPIKGFILFTWHSMVGWWIGLKHVVTTKDVVWQCTQTFFNGRPYEELLKAREEYIQMEKDAAKVIKEKYKTL